MCFNPLNLSGRKILITGASSGIGRATAIYLSKLGAQIVCAGRDKTRLQVTISQLSGEGHSFISYDLTDLDNIENIFIEATSDGIKLNGFVHSAGIPFVMPLRSLTPLSMLDCFKNNFFCFVELVRQFSKVKYSSGGSIVAISSINSKRPVIAETAYCTAKSALNTSIKSLALELSKKQIRINGILAGNIMTEMSKKVLLEYNNIERKDNEVKQSLIGRWGTPEDIAAGCAFLLSDMSSFITASLLNMGGGIK